jgi:hypothetical protein
MAPRASRGSARQGELEVRQLLIRRADELLEPLEGALEAGCPAAARPARPARGLANRGPAATSIPN